MAYEQRPASGFQPCDSFFVETYDQEFSGPRLDPKEHARLVARERQYAIADNLSRLTSEEYQEDVVAHMLQMDVSDTNAYLLDLIFFANQIYSLQPYLTLIRLISKPKFSGSCGPISSTS